MDMSILRVLGITGALAALLAVGCAGADQPGGTPPGATATSTPTTAGGPAGSDGEMTAVYEPAESPEAVQGRQLLEEAGLLEELADEATAMLRLPQDVPLVGRECGEANAFWDIDDRELVLCYEDAALGMTVFADDPDPRASTLGAVRATFYHELGHAVIDLYDLPFTGREEDVADQLAAVLLLETYDDRDIDPEDLAAAQAYARMFAADEDGVEDFPFWDVHEYDLARMYNLQCWIYGADPQGNAFVVEQELLPAERADSCPDEFDRMARAWDELLGPYLRTDE